MIPKHMLHEPDTTKSYMDAARRLVERGEIVTQEDIYEEAFRMLDGAGVKHKTAAQNWLGAHIAWLELHTDDEITQMVIDSKAGKLHKCEKCHE